MTLNRRTLIPWPGSPASGVFSIMADQARSLASKLESWGVDSTRARTIVYNVLLEFWRTKACADSGFTPETQQAVAAFMANWTIGKEYGIGPNNYSVEVEVEFDSVPDAPLHEILVGVELVALTGDAELAVKATTQVVTPPPPSASRVLFPGANVMKGGRPYQVRAHDSITDRVLLLGYGWVDRADLDPDPPAQVQTREPEALATVRPVTQGDWETLKAALADYDEESGDEDEWEPVEDENAEPYFDADAEPVIAEAGTPTAPASTSIVWVAPTPVPLAPPVPVMTQPVVPPAFDLNAAVSSVLLDWTLALKSFTAFDVTTCLRQAHPSERILHRDVRPLVHAAMANQRIYTRENVSTAGGLAIQYQPL